MHLLLEGKDQRRSLPYRDRSDAVMEEKEAYYPLPSIVSIHASRQLSPDGWGSSGYRPKRLLRRLTVRRIYQSSIQTLFGYEGAMKV